jgi:hypothetical protein
MDTDTLDPNHWNAEGIDYRWNRTTNKTTTRSDLLLLVTEFFVVSN